MGALARLFVRLSLDATGFISGIQSLIGRASGFGRALGMALALGAVAAATTGFAAMSGAFISSINAAAGFEAQMSQVQAAVGANNAEMEQLSGLARNLALDPGLSVSANDAAASFELLARNGLSADQILSGAGRAAITLTNSTVGANAQLSDFATTADVLTDAMSIFNVATEQTGMAVDSITGVVNNSKFSISTYQTALSNAARGSKSLGLGLEEVNTTLALISPNFGDASSAGTSLSRALLSLASPSKKARAAMNNLGISAFDAQGNFIGIPALIDELGEGFEGLSEQATAANLEAIFGSFGLQAAQGLLSSSSEAFDELNGKVNEVGIAQKTAATRVANFRGAMNLLRDTIQGVAISFGLPFLDPLQNGLRGVAGIISGVSPQIEAFAENTASRIAGLISAFQVGGFDGLFDELNLPAEVVGTIETVSTSIQDFAEFVVDNKDSIIGAITGIGIALGALVIGGSIAAVIAGIASLLNPITAIIAVAALLGAAWNANWFGIQERVAAAWAFLKPIFDQVVLFIQNLINQFVGSDAFAVIVGIFQQIASAIQIFMTAIQAGQTPLAAFQIALSSVFGEGAAASFTTLVEVFNQVREALFSTFGPILTNLISQFQLAWANLTPSFQQIVPLIQNLAMILGVVLGAAITLVVALIAGLLNGIAGAIPYVTAAITNIVTFISGVVQLIVSLFQLIVAWISGDSSAISQAATMVGESFSTILSSISEFATNIVAAATALLAGFLEGALTFISDLWTQVTGKSTEGLDTFIESLSTFQSDAVAFFTEAIASIKKTFTDVDWGAVGTSIIDGIKSGITAAKDALLGSVSSVASSAVAAFKSAIGANSPAKKFIPSGEDIVGGIAVGIEKNKSAVTDPLQDLANTATSVSGEAFTTMSDSFDTLRNMDVTGGLEFVTTVSGLDELESGLDDISREIEVTVSDIEAQIESSSFVNQRQTPQAPQDRRTFHLREGAVQLNVKADDVAQADSTTELLLSQLEESLL